MSFVYLFLCFTFQSPAIFSTWLRLLTGTWTNKPNFCNLKLILTHLAYIVNGKKKTCYIVQQFHSANKRDVTLRHLWRQLSNKAAFDGKTLQSNICRDICNAMAESWTISTVSATFFRLLCVRIEIDQLKCVNCWVIIHCLSVSCKKINHSRYALVIGFSLKFLDWGRNLVDE